MTESSKVCRRLRRYFAWAAGFLIAAGLAPPAAAAEGAPHLDGATLGLIWCLPFAGLLLSIAVLPLLAPSFWHHHYGKVSLAWSAGLLAPLSAVFGVDVAFYHALHTLAAEYLPFVALLLALYTVSSGVQITGRFTGRPGSNTAVLAFGTLIASWVGTTGACMLLVQPLLRANRARKRNVHVFVFFIILVGNIGGALTPLGDPPLFLGYLEGVDFFWFTRHMLVPMLAMVVPLLIAFYLVDRRIWRRDGEPPAPAEQTERFGLVGKRNLVLLAAIVGVVLVAGSIESGIAVPLYHFTLPLEDIARTVTLTALAWVSWRVTPMDWRTANDFTWAPMSEVAKLFIGIFVTMVPALAIIQAGAAGAAGPLLANLAPGGHPDNDVYFWVTGVLSSVLDNAPTYLIFFNLAGGDATQLMGPLASTLVAISAGAVFMGANTYVGNAPNFLVKSICEKGGIRMPSFFGYAIRAVAYLLPLYVLLTWLLRQL